MSTNLRPEVKTSTSGIPAPDRFDSLWMIRDAVRRKDRLIYGRLHANGQSCAIGAFWDDNPKVPLSTAIIEEVASYNDSIPPHVSERTRKAKVLAWLNAKLRHLSGGAAQ